MTRTEYTKRIEDVLLDDSSDQCRIFVLHGMGGIGKTQLAMNFAYKHKNMFDSVFWLQAQTEDALRQSLVRSAKRIPRDQISEKSRRANPADASEQQEIIDEVLEWLGQEGNSNWLLVFDNIDLDPNSAEDRKRGAFKVADYLPASQGSILITSRLETLSQIGGGRSREEVAMVGYELSKRIFEHWSGQTLGEIPDRFMHIAATDPLKMMMTTRRNFSVQRGSAVSLLQWRRLRCMSSRIPECLLRSIYAVLTRCGPSHGVRRRAAIARLPRCSGSGVDFVHGAGP